MESGTHLFLSLIFSSVGMGYMVYGKKQRAGIPLAAGLLLCAYPYFVTNIYLFFGLGVVLAVSPFFIKV